MKFIFLNADRMNLDNIPEIKKIRKFNEFLRVYKSDDMQIGFGPPQAGKNIFLIEVSKLSNQWTGDLASKDSFNTLASIPISVCEAVQKGYCRIAIISTIEGDSFLKPHWNAFKAMHHDIEQRKFPTNSVMIVSGNLKLKEEYLEWCRNENVFPTLDIVGGIDWDAREAYDPDKPLCIDTILRNHSSIAILNSLNRTDRPHRKQHIEWCEENIINFAKDNLISGYGHTVDLDNRKGSLGNTHNRKIYENSMLSVVTETFFDEPGLFITEKTFRCIALGHPCIVLGQPGILDYFDSIGINLRFPGLDTTYDSKKDHKVRFSEFHDTLEYWYHLTVQERYPLLKSWKPILQQNAKVYSKINFHHQTIDNIIKSSEQYFLTKP